MKRVLSFLFVLALLAGIGIGPAPGESGYIVEKGDTLWDLSAAYKGDPMKWGEVLGANPFLKEPGRIIEHRDGRVIVIIRPGEQLQGLERLGVTVTPVPISELGLAQPVSSGSTDSLWFWLGLALLAMLGVLLARYLYGRYLANPATAGEPVVRGGIPPQQPDAITARFQRMAEERYNQRFPAAPLEARPERVGEIESGFLSGNGRVRYGDGRIVTRHLRREPAYRARFQFPGQSAVETLYFLQRCANDVTYTGARYEGFTFEPAAEPQRVVVPPPEPERTPAGPVTPLRVVAEHQVTEMTFGRIKVTFPEGTSVQVAENGQITLAIGQPGTVTVAQLKPKRAQRPKVVRPAAGAERTS